MLKTVCTFAVGREIKTNEQINIDSPVTPELGYWRRHGSVTVKITVPGRDGRPGPAPAGGGGAVTVAIFVEPAS